MGKLNHKNATTAREKTNQKKYNNKKVWLAVCANGWLMKRAVAFSLTFFAMKKLLRNLKKNPPEYKIKENICKF